MTKIQRAREDRRQRKQSKREQKQHDAARWLAWLNWYRKEATDCARKAGLCPGCGRFVAGNEWDDFFLQKYGLCEGCQYEFERETSKYLDDDTLGYYIGGDEQ